MTLPSFELWQWALLYLAAFSVGLAKTGLPGVGILAVGLFPMLLPARAAMGSVLLLLISADIIAVCTYRRDAEWKYLARLFPFAAVGVVLGYLVMNRMSDSSLSRLIGAILLALVLFQFWQRLRPRREEPEEATPAPPILSAGTGILAGFTTMIANAAGPIMILYLLAMRLPKIAFIGTAAWFFFTVNLFKVPFGIGAKAVTLQALALALTLFPGALAGALAGRILIKHINQKVFEWLALLFTLVAGIKLILS